MVKQFQGIGINNRLNTIMADNGKEFVEHLEIAEKLDVKVYFVKSYYFWKRSTNENINCLIWQCIPMDSRKIVEDL